MTSSAARTVANVIVFSAGAAAVGVVLASPPLRRLAFTGLRWWLGASVPAFLIAEVRQAWAESARAT